MLPGTFEEVVSANALGSYAYWGRRLLWSPDGDAACLGERGQPGIGGPGNGRLYTLMTFKEYAPLLERFQGASVWIPTLSWSRDGHLVTTHARRIPTPTKRRKTA